MSRAAPDLNNASKVRMRNEAELREQGETLGIVKEVLELNGIQPLLFGGTLLGLVRHGDFIPWDWDAEFFVRLEDVKCKADALLGALADRGFHIEKAELDRCSWKIEARKCGFSYEVRGWRKVGSHRVRAGYAVPECLVAGSLSAELRGISYRIPHRYEEVLEHLYGDWRTPKRTTNKQEYNSRNYYIKSAGTGRQLTWALRSRDWSQAFEIIRSIARSLIR